MKKREFFDDRVCVVVGSNTGIGLEIARGLALMRCTVIMACRNEERGRKAVDEIIEDTCNDKIELMLVDTSSQASVRKFAAELLDRHDKLHVLINNAAVWMDERKESADGVEMTWATNVLGVFLLTNLLLDRLKQSAPARVINVASRVAHSLDLDDPEFKRRPFNGVTAYAQSKQALRMLTWAYDLRNEGSRVTFNAYHPGMVNTEITRNSSGLLGALSRPFFRAFGRSPAQGADTAIWLATDDENERSSGNFWVDRKIKRCNFRDQDQIDRLWQLCDRATTP